MWLRHATVLICLIGSVSIACAQDFHIEEVASATATDVAQIKPQTIAFSDEKRAAAGNGDARLIHFTDWEHDHPTEKRFLALFPTYSEPTVSKKDRPKPIVEKLYMYVAQARFVIDRAPATVDLSHYVNLTFLQKIDPAIEHKLIAASDIKPFTEPAGVGNDNPDRKWCTERATLICFQSTYKLEGKIPLGILLVNKLRDSEKKIADHIDFESELSALASGVVDQSGLQQLTKLDAPVEGVLEQNIFRVNEIMKFGKLFAVFQDDTADAGKTVVTAFMALGIKASVLDERRGFEKVPVLRNLVPAEVLMGKSSFNSGKSISAGLPQYARNEITTIAGILQHDSGAK